MPDKPALAFVRIKDFNAAVAALKPRGLTVNSHFEIVGDGKVWNFSSPEEIVAFRYGLEASDLALKRVAAIVAEELSPKEHPDA
jgi:hypothetical protein